MKISIKVVIERATDSYFYETIVFNVSSVIVNDSLAQDIVVVDDGTGVGDGAGVGDSDSTSWINS